MLLKVNAPRVSSVRVKVSPESGAPRFDFTSAVLVEGESATTVGEVFECDKAQADELLKGQRNGGIEAVAVADDDDVLAWVAAARQRGITVSQSIEGVHAGILRRRSGGGTREDKPAGSDKAGDGKGDSKAGKPDDGK